jgi:hypothetical protein
VSARVPGSFTYKSNGFLCGCRAGVSARCRQKAPP